MPLPGDCSHSDRIKVMTEMQQSILSFTANFGCDKDLSDLDSSELLRCLLVLSSQGEQALKWPELVATWKMLKQNNGISYLASLGEYLSKQKTLYAEIDACQKLLPKAEVSKPMWLTPKVDGAQHNFPKITVEGAGGTGNQPAYCVVCNDKTSSHKSHYCPNLQEIRDKK